MTALNFTTSNRIAAVREAFARDPKAHVADVDMPRVEAEIFARADAIRTEHGGTISRDAALIMFFQRTAQRPGSDDATLLEIYKRHTNRILGVTP